MVLAPVLGPACGTAKVVKHGRSEGGNQRYKCRHPDDMWRFVQSQQQQRWLWQVIAHHTGAGWADVWSDHKDTAVLKLKSLLAPFGMTQFDPDAWGADEPQLEPVVQTVGKAKTPTMARKPLTWRTRRQRFARQTLGCSKAIG